MILSHLGRPKEGQCEPEFSLAPVAARLSELLGRPVPLVKDWLDGVECAPGQRGAVRERALQRGREGRRRGARRAAWPRSATCTSWTPSAPRTAPSAAPTAWGASRRWPAPVRCWWPNSTRSSARCSSPRARWWRSSRAPRSRPSSRCLGALLEKVDMLIVGGGIANTFLAATGVQVGKSLCETEMLDIARSLMARAHARGAEIPLPTDVVVAPRVRGHRARRRARGRRGQAGRDDPRHRPRHRRAPVRR